MLHHVPLLEVIRLVKAIMVLLDFVAKYLEFGLLWSFLCGFFILLFSLNIDKIIPYARRLGCRLIFNMQSFNGGYSYFSICRWLRLKIPTSSSSLSSVGFPVGSSVSRLQRIEANSRRLYFYLFIVSLYLDIFILDFYTWGGLRSLPKQYYSIYIKCKLW